MTVLNDAQLNERAAAAARRWWNEGRELNEWKDDAGRCRPPIDVLTSIIVNEIRGTPHRYGVPIPPSRHEAFCRERT